LWQRGLSDAVLHAPEIAAMIAAGEVRVRQTPVQQASSADAETTPETQASRRRRASKE
jgi:hypothetical protein